MGWLDRLKQRWLRGRPTGPTSEVPSEREDRLLGDVPPDERAATWPEGQKEKFLDEGRPPGPGER
jgi:hypothetical protein